MFTDPQTVNGAPGTVFALQNLDGNRTTRGATATQSVGDVVVRVTMSIGHQETNENKPLGGSFRHLLRFDKEVKDPTSNAVLGSASAQLVVVHPKGVITTDEMIGLMQGIVSFLTGENDLSLSTDATVDATLAGRFLGNEP